MNAGVSFSDEHSSPPLFKSFYFPAARTASLFQQKAEMLQSVIVSSVADKWPLGSYLRGLAIGSKLVGGMCGHRRGVVSFR